MKAYQSEGPSVAPARAAFRVRLEEDTVLGVVSGRRATGNSRRRTSTLIRPEVGRENPLNLSILLSGGRETNEDSLSNGE